MTGTVYLVGAGPGDVGLLTIRGRYLLETAGAVVYDRLVSPGFLDFVRPSAKRVYVGKAAGNHTMRQADIEALLVELTQTYTTVVRLKGGDPFVFGRGGEEAAFLTAHGVPWEVVPGVTSAVAVPAYAGIPLTQRGVSDGFMVLTGQSGGAAQPDVRAATGLLKGGGTLVVLMGMGHLADIQRALVDSGVPRETPAAVIAWGTRAAQKTLVATLAVLPERVKEAGIGAPAVVVIGAVAALHDELAWQAQRPLAGHRLVLAVETEREATLFGNQLDGLGAERVTFCAERQAVVDMDRMNQDIAWVHAETRNGARPWLCLATALDVALFMQRWLERGADVRRLANVQIRAGHPTAVDELRRYGICPDAAYGTAHVDYHAYASGFTVPEQVREAVESEQLVQHTPLNPVPDAPFAGELSRHGVIWASSPLALQALRTACDTASAPTRTVPHRDTAGAVR